MAQTVGQHSVAAFTSPVNGDPLNATVVVANDNSTRSAYVDHDSDTGIHVQSSLLAARPAAGTAGRKWMTTDTGDVNLWFDTGAAWEEISYLPVASGNVTIPGTLGVTGLITATGGMSGNVTGAVTGNASTATTLQTSRNINGVAFNGSADITITAVADASTLSGTTLNSPVVASSLTSVGTLTSLTTSGTTSLATSAGALTVRSVPYIWPSSQGAATTALVNNGSGTLSWTLVGASTPTQTDFNASGTWTKPSSGSMAMVEVWGGGGGGATGNSWGSGGGGGAYNYRVYRLADLSATVAVTVGAGGLGQALGTLGDGTDGGTSSFGSLLSAYGGQKGWQSSQYAMAIGGHPTLPISNFGGNQQQNGSFGSNQFGQLMGSLAWVYTDRMFSGGTGISYHNAFNIQPGLATSVYGGGGGTGNSTNGGGVSTFAGNGGNEGNDGTAPAGGGGGSSSYTSKKSGAGGSGRVRVTVFG